MLFALWFSELMNLERFLEETPIKIIGRILRFHGNRTRVSCRHLLSDQLAVVQNVVSLI